MHLELTVSNARKLRGILASYQTYCVMESRKLQSQQLAPNGCHVLLEHASVCADITAIVDAAEGKRL